MVQMATILGEAKLTRTAYAVLSFNWSPSFNSWSFKGDNHHEDPMFLFTLTSSRIDSIRTQQYLGYRKSELFLYAIEYHCLIVIGTFQPTKTKI
jgi:hypothetical protein